MDQSLGNINGKHHLICQFDFFKVVKSDFKTIISLLLPRFNLNPWYTLNRSFSLGSKIGPFLFGRHHWHSYMLICDELSNFPNVRIYCHLTRETCIILFLSWHKLLSFFFALLILFTLWKLITCSHAIVSKYSPIHEVCNIADKMPQKCGSKVLMII